MGHETMAERPARMTITALATGETVEMQYNPTEIEETFGAVYARQIVPGMSHEILQFTHSKAPAIKFDLAFDALANSKDYDADDALNARRFLQSLTVPRRGATSVRAGAPSRALFIWPELYTLTTVLTTCTIKFTRFAKTAKPTAFSAACQIEEIRDFRITAEEILADGTQRADSGGVAGVRGG